MSEPRSGARAVLTIYAATLFLSAALLFVVEPLFAKMVLPRLGGTPAVWTTCMVFFQAALLAGYLYAHFATRWLPARRLAWLHLPLLAAPFVVLPLAVPGTWVPRADASPVGSLLGVLALTVGLPFFAVSTSGPLLQKWFAESGHPSARDPYFLYGASNVGSMIGLLAYPFVLEPLAELRTQSWIWTAGYGALVTLTAACALVAARGAPLHEANAAQATAEGGPLTGARRLRWVALAAVPSSLMLGVTTHITTEIGAFPLLWVIPLALYIASFVVAFGRRQLVPQALLARVLVFLVLALAALKLTFRVSTWVDLPLHVLAFFAFAVVLHGALAKDRPSVEHLTGYYVLLSLGGVLGGLFNGIVAPLVFTSVLEYPIAIVAGCLLVPAAAAGSWKRDLAFAIALGLAVRGGLLLAERIPLSYVQGLFTLVAVPVVVLFLWSRRPVRFGLGVAALVVAHAPSSANLLHEERSFFAISRVVRMAVKDHAFMSLFHGSTLHGRQRLDAKSGAPIEPATPLTYYSKEGPIGQIVASRPNGRRVGVVGLGAGAVAAYAQAGSTFTFFEIDPVVVKIAEDERFFTYLADARRRGAAVPVVLGDARLTIQGAAPASFDILILDAFSSDSVPVHIVTREALRLYVEKLAPGGLLAFNVSNRYLDLRPVLAALAADAGLVTLGTDSVLPEETLDRGAVNSAWVVLARSSADLGPLGGDPRWKPLVARPGVRAWTDSFSNVLDVLGAKPTGE